METQPWGFTVMPWPPFMGMQYIIIRYKKILIKSSDIIVPDDIQLIPIVAPVHQLLCVLVIDAWIFIADIGCPAKLQRADSDGFEAITLRQADPMATAMKSPTSKTTGSDTWLLKEKG